MRFEQRTYTILPRQPSQPTFGEFSLNTPCTNCLSTFIRDNRPTTGTFHLEFAGVHTISLPPTPSLVPVNLVRSSGVPALTGHYLVDMLPRNGLSSETETFVTDAFQTIPLSGFTDLEPGTILGTYSSPPIQLPTSALHEPTTDVHALHDNIPVANDGLPPTDSPPTPKTPSPELLERLSDGQRTSFLRV